MLLASVILLSTNMTPAFAYRTYSIAHSFGYGNITNNVTGVYVIRSDVSVTSSGKLGGGSCDIPEQNYPVYQTQWIPLVSATHDWIELGTGHQCSITRWWYWGFGWQDTWYPQGRILGVPASSTDYFDIHRVGEYWYWQINGVQRGSAYYWNAIGQHAEAGLESYDDHAFIPVHIYGNLLVTMSEGAWTPWNSLSAHLEAGLCGAVISSSQYEGWQDSSC